MTKALNFVKILNVVAECHRMSTGKCGIITLTKMKNASRGYLKDTRRAVGGQLQGTVKSDKVYTGNVKEIETRPGGFCFR